MENNQFNNNHIDMKKIESNPQQTIDKSKQAVMLLIQAGDLLEEAGLVAVSRDSLFLAKSVATFVNDFEKDISETSINIDSIKITEKDYEATLALIKAMDIDDE